MGQQTFDTTDYGEMTLAKLDATGVEFLLKRIEVTKGNFGDFIVLMGSKDGEPFEIRAGGRAGKLFMKEGANLMNKVIRIVPSGEGMQRKYTVSVK